MPTLHHLLLTHDSDAFLALCLKSQKSTAIINAVLQEFSDEDWVSYKNFIASLIHSSPQVLLNTLNIDYSKSAPHFNKDQWVKIMTLVPTINSRSQGLPDNIKAKLEPYFKIFLQKNENSQIALKYLNKHKKFTNKKSFIQAANEFNINCITQPMWTDVLSCLGEMSFVEKLEIVNLYKIDPLYSSATFYAFTSANRSSTSRSYIEDTRQIYLCDIPDSALQWFVQEIKVSEKSVLDTFFDNKFGIQTKKKKLTSTQEFISAMKNENIKDSKLIQDYAYLICFCNTLLNPSNNKSAMKMAVALDSYISKKMLLNDEHWSKKVQKIINTQAFRKFLTYTDKNMWNSIYEKISIENLIPQTSSTQGKEKKKFKL